MRRWPQSILSDPLGSQSGRGGHRERQVNLDPLMLSGDCDRSGPSTSAQQIGEGRSNSVGPAVSGLTSQCTSFIFPSASRGISSVDLGELLQSIH